MIASRWCRRRAGRKVRGANILSGGLILLGLLAVANPTPVTPALAADNPIVVENQQPGTGAWQLGSSVADDVNGQIKGYASATSVSQGQSLTLYVTVNPVQSYTLDIYRIGWYQGLGGRLRLHQVGLQGSTQKACTPDATTGLIACNWTPSTTLSIPADWTSGVYLALLTNAQGYQNYVDFVVKDSRSAAFLYQQSVTTYEAYNDYPNDGLTGKSLYGFNSYGATTISGEARAVKVSFDRPFAGDGAGHILNWEVNYLRWLERSGYDVTYSTDIDTHANPAALLNHRAFLSIGHDEYWSKEMYDAVQAARDAGINLGFFGADAVYWQVRFEASAAGSPNRVMVCYKYAPIDPVQGATTTVNFRSAPVNRPEQALMGVQYTSEVDPRPNVGYVVTNSSHWVYAGTGFHDGDVVPGIVGYEMDRAFGDVPLPGPTSRTILSRSPYTDVAGMADYANSSIYQAPSGAWVFAAGTIAWSWGLDDFNRNLSDPRIQQTTANVLNAFVNGAPIVHDLKVTAPITVKAGQTFPLSVTAENAQGTPVTQYSGSIHFTTSDASAGVLLPADATLTNGQGTFSATLDRAGPQTVTVSDAANGLSTTVTIAIIAAPASQLVMAAMGAPTATAGNGISFRVTAQDQFGNMASAYTGRVHFSTSDGSVGIILPPDATLSNGQGTFSATLDKAGAQTVTGTDTATATISGTMSVSIRAASPATVNLWVPATVKANLPFTATVMLTDRFGNAADGYTGTVHFTTSDPLGTVPADYQFAGADVGHHTFAVTLTTPSTPLTPGQTITVTDTANGSLRGTSPPIAVSAT